MERKLRASMDSTASSVLHYLLTHTIIHTVVLVEQSIPFLSACASFLPFISWTPLRHTHTAFYSFLVLTFFLCSNVFFPLIHLLLLQYVHPIIPIFLLCSSSHIPYLTFLCDSLIPLCIFPNLSRELGILFIILLLPHTLLHAFAVWVECKVHRFINAIFLSPHRELFLAK